MYSSILISVLLTSIALLVNADDQCFDSPGFTSNFLSDICYCGGGCDWFAMPLGDDDYEYYDDIYGDLETRCEAFGDCCIEDGGTLTASVACCACGGGFLAPDVPSVTPTSTSYPTLTNCYDVPGWYSADSEASRNQFDCAWFGLPVADDDDYYSEGDTRCDLFGDEEPNFGYTANEACCVCGGGFYGENVPSPLPTISMAPSESEIPSEAPTVTSSPTVYCADIAGWKDSNGARCSWYTQPVGLDDYYDDGNSRCDLYGDLNENNGFTANTACCVCGGGDYTKSPKPSNVLSNLPSSSPSSRSNLPSVKESSKSSSVPPSSPTQPEPFPSPSGTPITEPPVALPVALTESPITSPFTPTGFPTEAPITQAPVGESPIASPTAQAPVTSHSVHIYLRYPFLFVFFVLVINLL